jgi:hypothetical protein
VQLIAKLDRLSRNVHFIGGLMERKIDFVACDMPSANAFMINIYAAVAQEERRMISERTKAGLRAAREACNSNCSRMAFARVVGVLPMSQPIRNTTACWLLCSSASTC